MLLLNNIKNTINSFAYHIYFGQIIYKNTLKTYNFLLNYNKNVSKIYNKNINIINQNY